MLRVLSQTRQGWSYRIRENHVKDGQQHISTSNIPWHNELDCARFFETFTGQQIVTVLQKFVGDSAQQEYQPYQMVTHLIRRGDFTNVDVDASSDDDEISMIIFLSTKLRKNDYGELFL